MRSRFAAAVAVSLFVTAGLLTYVSTALAVDGVIDINSAVVTTFPFSITQPGSYRLTGNLAVTSGADGIDVTADNVNLDLNGFAIIGAGGGTGIASTHSQVTVRNGMVTGMGGKGISLGANATVADVHAVGNGGNGIVVGDGSLVKHSVSNNNSPGVGISAGGGCMVIENSMMNNSSYGLKVKDVTTGIAYNVLTANNGNSTIGNPNSQINGNGAPNQLFNNLCNGTACTGS